MRKAHVRLLRVSPAGQLVAAPCRLRASNVCAQTPAVVSDTMKTRLGERRSPAAEADAAIDQTDPFAVPVATRRREIKGSATIVALCGAWLLVSPIVLPYETGDAVWNPVLAGVAIMLLALVRVTVGIWHSWISWLNAILGAWIIASAFWLADSPAASWNQAAVGGAIIVLALLSGGATDAARRQSRDSSSRR